MVRRFATVPLLAALTVLLTTLGVRADPPAGKGYPFAVPPLEIHDRFAKAELCPVVPIAPADRAILAEFWAARSAVPRKAVPEADDAAVTIHLLAAGVSDAQKRAAYLKKFNELVASSKTAIAGTKNDRERADQLLRHLHKAAMAKGYEAKTTTLPEIFDSGKYNCVSSSALYYLVVTRLGLKLQPVLIPGTGFSDGHAAVDLLDGNKRIELEPTNPDGYDWPTKLKKPGVIVIGPQPDRKKAYDSDGFGLAASTASNLAQVAVKADPPRHGDAVRSLVVALVLSPTDPTAETNTVAVLSNWGVKLGEAKKFEEALKVYAFGRAALGPVKSVEQNYRVVWEHYLDDTFGAQRFGEGLKLLARAATAFPAEKGFTKPAEWVTRAAHHTEEKKGWPAALAVADAGIKELGEGDAKAVRAWKDTARRLWSQELLKKGDVAGSLKVITDGFAEAPNSKELAAGLAHHAHAAIEYLDTKRSTAEAVAHLKELRERFPKNTDVPAAALEHASRIVRAVAGGKKFAEALKVADAYAGLAGDKLAEVKADVFDAWARSLSADKKWEDGLAKYTEGLAACPKNPRLSNNAIVLIDRWAEPAMDKKDWDAAIRVYDTGLKQFPMDRHLEQNRAYCVEQKNKK